jgi:hypothetical protein
MTSIMDTKNMELEQWGWFIDLESNEKIIIKNKEVDKNDLLRKEFFRREIETKEKVENSNLENKKKEKSELILYLKKRYKLCIYNLILNLVCSVSIVFIIKFMIIL